MHEIVGRTIVLITDGKQAVLFPDDSINMEARFSTERLENRVEPGD